MIGNSQFMARFQRHLTYKMSSEYVIKQRQSRKTIDFLISKDLLYSGGLKIVSLRPVIHAR